MKTCIIIPCYNEAATIVEVIAAVSACPVPGREIIVVDDCSTDGTREILRQRPEGGVDKIMYHERNRGKGAAVRSGIKATTGDIVVVQDADLEYDPQDIPRLIQPIIDGKADVVYGSRFAGSGPKTTLYLRQTLGNRFLTFFSNMLTGLRLTDMETGYKAFRKEVLDSIEIEEDRFGFEPEITAKVAKQGRTIREVAVTYRGRTYEEGKKITWRDGLSAIRCIVQYNVFR